MAFIVHTVLKGTFLHVLDPLQLLLAPITLYDGLLMGYVWGELTRASVSCTLGVDQVTMA